MSLESAPPFVHLRVKSAYSLADGAIPVKGLVKLAAGLDMPAVALTDRGNLFGALEFAVTAADAGLQPVVGAVSCEERDVTSGELADANQVRRRTERRVHTDLAHRLQPGERVQTAPADDRDARGRCLGAHEPARAVIARIRSASSSPVRAEYSPPA